MNIEIKKPELEALIERRLREEEIKDLREVLLHALQSSPVDDAEQAPGWLKDAWANARETGLEALSMDEIDAEIAAARAARRKTKK